MRFLHLVLIGFLLLSACSNYDNKELFNSTPSSNAKTSGYDYRKSSSVTKVDYGNINHNSKRTYIFSINSSKLGDKDIKEIQEIAGYLYQHPEKSVRLDGYTCELGSSEYNIALGYRRAKEVAAMIEKKGVSAHQLLVVSYGKEKPAFKGHSEKAWSKNRRVELFFMN